MSETEQPLTIDYYTDILCVWAWVAQRRVEELHQQFGSRIILHYHYLDVFGDTAGKIQTQWADRGLYEGFAEHVIHSASSFRDAPVNRDIWAKVRPATSANAHLVLKAAAVACGLQVSNELALEVRKAFFVRALDVSDMDTLYGIADEKGLDIGPVQAAIRDGSAMAALMGDYQSAKSQALKGSPSYVMAEGRQTLYGNVGYRVLHANVEELLKNPADEACWC